MDGLEFSEELQEEEVVESLTFAGAPVDPQRPGFGSLLTALKLAREGRLERQILQQYHEGLSEHLAESRERLESLEVPEALREALEAALGATRGMLDRMGAVLDRLGLFLATSQPVVLEEAIRILEGIHGEMEQVLRQAT